MAFDIDDALDRIPDHPAIRAHKESIGGIEGAKLGPIWPVTFLAGAIVGAVIATVGLWGVFA